MKKNRFRSESVMDAAGIEGLSALLRQWKGVEPRSDFEAAVWRKIRTTTTTGYLRGPKSRQNSGLLWRTNRPAWTAAAAAAALIVGASMGYLSHRTFSTRSTTHPLLQPRTVAGAYLSVATGEPR